MKITVAILDKDAAFRGVMLEKLSRLAKEYDFEMCINGYSTPKELEENELPFDLLMMDTTFEAPFEDGIEWVKMQAPSLRYLQLMYVSNEEDKVFDAIGTGPVAFIRKSSLETDLPKALRRYREKLDSMPEFVVVAEGRKRHVYIPDEIIQMGITSIFSLQTEKRSVSGERWMILRDICLFTDFCESIPAI